VITM